jgi:sugar lactone lactonase YvrE
VSREASGRSWAGAKVNGVKDAGWHQGSGLAIFLAIFILLVILSTAALADGLEGGEENPLPSAAEVAGVIESSAAGSVEPAITDASAADGLPLDDLGRDQALELLTGVFAQQVEAPAGIYDELQEATVLSSNVAVVPLGSLDSDSSDQVGQEGSPVEDQGETPSDPDSGSEAKVEGSPQTAARSEGEPPPSVPAQLANSALIDSTVPLRVEGAGDDPVDLSLTQVGDQLEAVNPLVDVQIPQELGQGIQLPQAEIAISLPGASSERSPTVAESSVAFYPNVEADTDLAVSPTPSGVETLTQLRGAESPTTEVYDLSLPEGAELVATAAGGAEVRSGDEVLMTVQPPSALDASGEPVPVDLEVAGSAVKIQVSPPEDANFPILVDPLFQTYEWHKKGTSAGICSNSFQQESFSSCNNREEWGYEVLEYPWGGAPHLTTGNGWGPAQPGIFVHAEGAQRSGDHASVIYTVPRYFKESPAPTSFIKSLKLSDVTWQALGQYASPYLFMGIWNPTSSSWVSYYSHTGQVEHGLNDPAFAYEFPNPGPNTNAKVASVGIFDTESTASSNATAYVGAATVELGDTGAPSGPIPTPQTQWVNQSAPPLAFTASDTGLGVYAITAGTEQLNSAGQPVRSWKASNGCIGVGDAACPRTWSSSEPGHQALSYEPAVLPNGINYLSLVAEDPVGNKSTSSWEEVKVDHQAPSLAVSGNLTEQASVGTQLTEYTLSYSAADGEDAAAEALLPFGVFGSGNGQFNGPTGIAVDAKGSAWVVDRGNNRLEKFNEGGFVQAVGSLGSTGGKLNAPSAVAIDPNGNIWVADTGNNRVEGFNENGEFLIAMGKDVNKTKVEALAPEAERNLCTAASGNVCQAGATGTIGKPPKGPELNAPQGVAATSGGNIWIADTGHSRLVKYSPAGAVLNESFSEGSGTGQLKEPTGLAIGSDGSIWVADTGNNRIQQWNSSLAFVQKFGSLGSGAGQFNAPTGLAFAPSGNVLVTDRGNNRIEVFQPSGAFLRQFGTAGGSNANLSAPSAVAMATGNVALVADKSNHRIARWGHADRDPQSGAAKVEVKVDGSSVKTQAPGCATKNCEVAGSWTFKADEYAVGSHKVDVIATDGVGLTTTKTLNVESHGDLTAPSAELSGSMTSQATLGNTRPQYKLYVSAGDAPASTGERESGVASITAKLDGTLVSSVTSGFPFLEWTLNSNSYSVGSHTVEVKVTDGAGRTTTKTLPITIERDTTPPQLEATNFFYTAPEGWLEQDSYNYNANATDVNGYGVTALTLKIDGTTVRNVMQSCPSGNCSKSFGTSSSIDIAQYKGGSHAAELIATDGAGNTRKRSWTMNVDPEGQITAGEAADTLEAVESTTAATPVAPTQELLDPEQIEGGNNPGLEQTGSQITSTGVPDVTTMTTDPGAGFTISSPYGETTITPVVSETSSITTIEEGVAGVSANVSDEVDSVIRPEYNGVQIFHAIRSEASPEKYSWTVQLYEGQVLELADSQHAQVMYESGKRAFLITAEEAHDATGKEVPTSLEVDGNVLTLNVEFHNAAFVYPILAGAGWETSYNVPYLVEGPEDELEIKERELTEQEEEGPAPPPPASGYFTETEAQNIIASGNARGEVIPAPEPASGGASASSVPEKVVEEFRICANLGCAVWWVKIWNPSYHYRRSAKGLATAYWQDGTQVHAESWFPAYYSPELDVDTCDAGFRVPYQVWAGEHKHLTTFGRFLITATAFTIGGDTLDFDNRLALKIWVWPNGFQQRVQTHWEETPEYIENGGRCVVAQT